MSNIDLKVTIEEKYWHSQNFDFQGLRDTHREKAPSNKTPALRKSRNMDIWVVGTPNQVFMRGS